MAGNALHDHVERDEVVPALEHDDVRVLAARLNVLLVHGLDGREVLRDDALERAAAVAHVAQGAAQNAHVRVGLDKNLDVKHLTQRGILKDENALDDDDLARQNEFGFLGALMVGVGVNGAMNGLAGFELLELFDHQIRFESVRVVVVLLAAFFEGKILVLIIAVVMDDADIVAEVLLQMLGERRFARTGATCNANEDGVHRQTLHESFVVKSIIGRLWQKSKAARRNAAKICAWAVDAKQKSKYYVKERGTVCARAQRLYFDKRKERRHESSQVPALRRRIFPQLSQMPVLRGGRPSP